MADAIRIASGGRWTYVPDTQEYRSRLERFSAAGMAEVRDGVVHLLSEAGPLFWDSLKRNDKKAESKLRSALAAIVEDGLSLEPDEELCFGCKENSLAYSTPLDVSLLRRDKKPGLTVSFRLPKENEIVSTLWPKSKLIIPAMLGHDGAELADQPPKGERCFVLDESCRSLLTIASPASEKAIVRTASPKAFGSWLYSTASAARPAGNFSILFQSSGRFVISDANRHKIYVGQMLSAPEDKEHHEFEKATLETLLTSKGLGAILPKYALQKGE